MKHGVSVTWRVLAHSTTTGTSEGSQRRDTWTTVTPTDFQSLLNQRIKISNDLSLVFHESAQGRFPDDNDDDDDDDAQKVMKMILF